MVANKVITGDILVDAITCVKANTPAKPTMRTVCLVCSFMKVFMYSPPGAPHGDADYQCKKNGEHEADHMAKVTWSVFIATS